jgi:hypothetical protein
LSKTENILPFSQNKNKAIALESEILKTIDGKLGN